MFYGPLTTVYSVEMMIMMMMIMRRRRKRRRIDNMLNILPARVSEI